MIFFSPLRVYILLIIVFISCISDTFLYLFSRKEYIYIFMYYLFLKTFILDAINIYIYITNLENG